MIDVRVAGYSLREILSAPPRLSDQVEGVCRTLDLQLRNSKEIGALLGKTVEVFRGDQRIFYGSILKRGLDTGGQANLLAYDPLFLFKRNTDDYYYKKNTATATTIFKDLATKTGVKVASLANTKVSMPALYYQAADPDKILGDVLARTKQGGGGNYWYRYDPSLANRGLVLFERKVPTLVWAFQVGVNLTSASFEESAEELVTQVKLVNRETGKSVVRKNDEKYALFGKRQHFEEINKEEASNMDRKAGDLLGSLSKIKMTSQVEGVNPGNMPVLWSGDVIYVEERHTGIIGAYHIRNITQEFHSTNYITVAMDIEKAASIPEIQYEDATKAPEVPKPKEAKKATKKKVTTRKK